MNVIKLKDQGFTLVELIVVTVIVAILAAITIVTYNGVTDRARRAAIQSDLSNLAKSINLYAVHNGTYPANSTQLIGGGDAPIKLASFTRNPDPYMWVIYCYDGNNYVLAARQSGTTEWHAAGSAMELRRADEAGVSGSYTAICANLGVSATFGVWLKANAGWSTGLQ